MAMNDDEHFKSIWTSIFLRRGTPGSSTRLWDDCTDSQRAAALSMVNLTEGELPVLVGGTSAKVTVLLTTRQIADGRNQISVRDLLSVEPAEFGQVAKSQLNRLRIGTPEKKAEMLVELESGAPFVGFWSVLQHIAGKNARQGGAS
jgi:hypothetical protein